VLHQAVKDIEAISRSVSDQPARAAPGNWWTHYRRARRGHGRIQRDPWIKTYIRRIEHENIRKLGKGGYFVRGKGRGYSIVIPAQCHGHTLHMGHAFKTRSWMRYPSSAKAKLSIPLWQPGTDHAGIATQMVVERQ